MPAVRFGVRIRKGREIILSAYFKVVLYNITLGNLSGKQKLLKDLFGGYVLEWVLAVFIVSFLIWLIVWIVGRFRENEDRHVDASELLLQFSEMRREGDLTDDEFRSIKKRLIDSPQQGLKKEEIEKEETTDQID